MTMDFRYYPREFVVQFIELYKEQPCLWNINTLDYRDKRKRSLAYGNLLRYVKQYDENSTIDDIKKKINTLRACYRKEKKKVKDSLENGIGGDVYKPKLWYYDMLTFLEDMLGDVGNPNTTVKDEFDMNTSLKDCDVEDGDVDEDVEEEDQRSSRSEEFDSALQGGLATEWMENPSPPASISNPPSQRARRKRQLEETDKIIRAIGEKLTTKREDDEFDMLGKIFAKKMRNIAAKSRLKYGIADRLINEILFQAEHGHISMSMSISNPHPNNDF